MFKVVRLPWHQAFKVKDKSKPDLEEVLTRLAGDGYLPVAMSTVNVPNKDGKGFTPYIVVICAHSNVVQEVKAAADASGNGADLPTGEDLGDGEIVDPNAPPTSEPEHS